MHPAVNISATAATVAATMGVLSNICGLMTVSPRLSDGQNAIQSLFAARGGLFAPSDGQ
jgi:hypothetical protein